MWDVRFGSLADICTAESHVRRQHAGAATDIQHPLAVLYVCRIEYGFHGLACHRSEGRIVAVDIGVPGPTVRKPKIASSREIAR